MKQPDLSPEVRSTEMVRDQRRYTAFGLGGGRA
jgi:hypothetical protein